MKLINRLKGKQEESAESEEAARPEDPKILVVFDGSSVHDWPALFAEVTDQIRVFQVSWVDTQCVVYGDSGCMLSMQPVKDSWGEHTDRKSSVSVKPDFLIVRNQPRGPTPVSDKRNVLFGLCMAGIPAINSLNSIYMDLERPMMIGQLRQIERRLGHEAFPLIPINYYSAGGTMVCPPEPYPIVLKVWHAHAGQGKIKINDGTGWADMRTVVILHDDHLTAEPFFECEYGIRVQKVFDTIRVYKKNFTGSGWKSQFGGADLQDEKLTPEYERWAMEASKAYGGLDLLAIDALVAPDGSKVIIELNTTAIGIVPRHWELDSRTIRDEALRRLFEEPAREALTSSTKARQLKSVGVAESKLDK